MVHYAHRALLLSTVVVLPLLGATWILGLVFLLDSTSVTIVWIFAVVNVLQVQIYYNKCMPIAIYMGILFII